MGKFIVIEGMDGSGKSTQAKKLGEYLRAQGLRIKTFHFPSETGFYGETVSRFLRGDLGGADEVDPYFSAFIFAGDRRDMADKVRQWIGSYDIVLMDRYAFSNVAYQCAKLDSEKQRKKLREWILRLEFEEFAIPQPDISVFLSVPQNFVESQLKKERTGESRDYLEGKEDIHEKDTSLQQRVGEQYRALCETQEELVLVDCADSSGRMMDSEVIHEKLIEMLKGRGILQAE